MFIESAYAVLKELKGNKIIIVGAGKAGTELAEFLIANNVEIVFFFDNNKSLREKKIFGITVSEIKRICCVKYVVSTKAEYRQELIDQLVGAGISKEDIIVYYPTAHDEEYITRFGKEGLEKAISDLYRETFGYDMDWDNPRTYNEIINWEKARITDKRRTIFADKIKVREYVAETIGDQYLTQVFGKWKKPEDIDFKNIPEACVLKLNNGSARNIIIRNKRTIDEDAIREKFKTWMSVKWEYTSFEMHYRDIEPCIYCEELLEGAEEEGFCDYKVFCFHGVVKYIQRIRFEHTDKAKALFYDRNWLRQPFNQYYADDIEVEKPKFIDEIITSSEKLAKEFEHVRVDWFISAGGKINFGEMTFANWSGLVRFVPNEIDEYFGELIRSN